MINNQPTELDNTMKVLTAMYCLTKYDIAKFARLTAEELEEALEQLKYFNLIRKVQDDENGNARYAMSDLRNTEMIVENFTSFGDYAKFEYERMQDMADIFEADGGY